MDRKMVRRDDSLRRTLCAAAAGTLLFVSGCAPVSSAPDPQIVSSADASVVSAASSEEPHILPTEAMTVHVDGQALEDVFVLSYSWYGETYENPDSLNKIMMMHYSEADSVIPLADELSRIRLSFDGGEGAPEQTVVTQQGNTVQANTGLPYDIRELETVADADGAVSFEVQYGRLTMYYYVVDCRWENGNAVRYAFAVARP